MIQKPNLYSTNNAEAFQYKSVVDAYRYRPAYPPDTFRILAGLVKEKPRHVLDIGCGTGAIARNFVDYAERIDAVDFSRAMVTVGKTLPNGDHPHIRWLVGKAEEVDLDPPYGLIIAGGSIHWMDWNVVFPRFADLLLPDHYVAITSQKITPHPWGIFGDITSRYRTDGGFQPYDMFAELEAANRFHKVGEQETEPILFSQSIEDYIESYHSRSGFSRERMGQAKADAFDQEAYQVLSIAYPDGDILFQVSGTVIWGIPG
ncbi:MAG: methyltransferase domain-containing protein [Chloroflexota bacterium]